MTKAPVVYLETSVFLAIIKGEKGRVDTCRAVLDDGRTRTTKTITSALTLAEVVRGPDGVLPAKAEDTIKGFFRLSWLHVIDVDRIIANRARDVARDHGLKPPDAIHVATALERGAKTLFTFDDKILKVVENGLDVSKPKGQMALPNTAAPKPKK